MSAPRHPLQRTDHVRFLLLSWILAATLELFLLSVTQRSLSVRHMSFLRLVVVTMGIAGVLYGISRVRDITVITRWGIPTVFAVMASLTLASRFTWEFFLFCLTIEGVFIVYALKGWDNRPHTIVAPTRAAGVYYWITGILAIAFFLFISIWTVSRVLNFSVPVYDFGIFSQMFYYMKETGLPLTTLERDGLLSHFAVHVSPIYYLLLPFYWLFPTPATLQVLQAAVITSAVIPLWKIGTHHSLTGKQRMLLCALLLFYPAFSGGASFDIHENCFLTPLLLWLFYGIDRKNTPLTAIAALLTLMVKEDAAVYVAVVGLWLVCKAFLHNHDQKNLITGGILLAGSIVWFLIVTGYLAKYGDGVMTNRYSNFMVDGSGSLLSVARNAIMHPMKVIFECAEPEKLQFIALTLLPLLGLPLLTRRYERYLLLIPYVLINLMSDFPYQHSIFFQYTFGPSAFLFYLTLINLTDWKINRHRTIALGLAVILGASCCAIEVAPRAWSYVSNAITQREVNQNIRAALDTIPPDTPVAAGTFYAPYLSQRKVVYNVKFCTREQLLETQYVALEPSVSKDFTQYATQDQPDGLQALIALLTAEGYTLQESSSDDLWIYCKTP